MNEQLKNLWQKFKAHPEGNWILGWDDAQRLYKILSKIKPKTILDLGSGIGCSVSIEAQMLKDLAIDGHITGIEQFEKCHKLASELIPEELKGYIDNKLLPAVVKQYDEVPYKYFSAFEGLEPKHYDFVLIDGPGPWYKTMNGKDYEIKLPNGDFISLIAHLEPGAFIYLDQRLTTREIIGRYFAKYIGIIHMDNQYALLERNNVKYDGSFDESAPLLKGVGYKTE